MRPEGKDQLDSLYFDYPLFEAPIRRAAAGEVEEASVAIVGAGPVGLMAALTLASYGISSVVFEKKNTFNDGSRAICVARQSFHLFERVGALEPFLRKSLGWTKGRSFFRGKQILEFEMAHDQNQKFMPMYNLQQQYIEQFLWQAASRSELIDIRWQSEVRSINLDNLRASLMIVDPNGIYEMRAKWVLAADGARSSMRTMRGLKLKGENYEGRYVIADVEADLPVDRAHPTMRRALFDPVCLPGKTVLIHRQPDNIWRIDYQIDDDVSVEHATIEEVVRTNVAGVLKEIGYAGDWELEWWSSYTANTLLLDDYRDGRIFFIGDSAHIVPIFGVRGLNNGLIDAHNIGWKLAMVLSGEAGEGLLESYTSERRGATLDVFENASKSARFMTPPTYGWRLMRDAALSLALEYDFAGEFANPRQMTPYHYGESPITTRSASDVQVRPAPGAVVPNILLSDGRYFSDLLGRGFTGVAFSNSDDKLIHETEQRLKNLDRNFELLSFGELQDGETAPQADARLIAEAFSAEPGEFILVRPDMHIAARWRHPDLMQIQAELMRMLAI